MYVCVYMYVYMNNKYFIMVTIFTLNVLMLNLVKDLFIYMYRCINIIMYIYTEFTNAMRELSESQVHIL